MRHLPVYILIDTSGSMKGEPIESVKVGLADMVATLRQDPYALETVCISIITFDREVSQVLPLTELENLQMPDILTPDTGPTHLGKALKMLCDKIAVEVKRGTPEQKGDWRPLLFILTDGKPSDVQDYNQIIPKVKSLNFASIVACAAGPKAKVEPLQQLTDQVFRLDTMDATSFKKFFVWVSDVIGLGGKSVGTTDSIELPGPPEEVNIVI
ncbi:tellurium resistance protein TerY [Xylanibacter ruminicola]|uniref:Tellurium resistance protein n=2 Tax=Xylanibacter ruminicola TaxID=839 RepID=D5EUI5_XYLR2|nr:VWA domain-containing protein [Xylanibacter ruminicola]ADE82396.1 putative tellurium resistance protein [Xylanibacter ruminicola 23]GJG34435.1 tellurium resistance protein TerY [Xylanibacter ruminicola]SEH59263.1 Uncharacterized conserved protein YegL, contains vWA domain of TerY type [Xylanibacter ruminicola]